MSCLPSDVTYYNSQCMPVYDGSTTLNGAINSAVTALVLTSAASFPPSTSLEFFIQIDSEIMLVTQGFGTVNLTVIRAMAGTAAASHSSLANVTMPAGGPINQLAKPSFTQVGSGDTIDCISTSTSDTKIKLLQTGRDTTGVIKTETLTGNGQTAVTGAQAFGRLMQTELGPATTSTGTLASGTTTLPITTSGALPASGNYYLQMGMEVMQVTAGQGTASLTVTRAQLGTTATAHNSGDNVYLLPLGDVMVYDHTKVISAHTAQTGSANPTGSTPALMKLQSGDGATVVVGQVIRTTGGTGPQQIRTIIATSGYGTDVVAVSRSWGTVPDNTTTYDVVNGVQYDFAPNPITEIQMVH